MKIKVIVAVASVVALGVMGLLLVAGLFVPVETLQKLLGRHSDGDAPVVIDASGNQLEDATFQENADGSVTVVTPDGQAVPDASVAQPGAPVVVPPASPAPPAPGCGSGGSCGAADIQTHSSSSDCWAAINIDGSGMKVYAIPASFLSLHASEKSIAAKICGKTYSANLRSTTSDHRGGSLGGQTYDQWFANNNWYIGEYN